MDDKVHEGIRIHEREKGNGDLMWQPRCNIINKKSHPTCSNKSHWCSTSLCSRTNLKWQNHVWILFNKDIFNISIMFQYMINFNKYMYNLNIKN
jgi:hypothetical protein